MIKKVAFTMYPVENMERARKFYEEVLRMIPYTTYAEGAWVEYNLPQGGCFAITTLAIGVTPSANAGGSVAFEVDNVEMLVQQLKTMNVTIKKDILTTPVCKMAVILDSEGNALTLHELSSRHETAE